MVKGVKHNVLLKLACALYFLWLLFLLLSGGCATQQTAGKTAAPPESPASTEKSDSLPGFISVTVQKGDTLHSLAAEYLHDPTMDWFIADFNGFDTVFPGQEIIIPLSPYAKGGLTPVGYQIVPVLSYHKFSLNEVNKMTVRKETFEQQMKFLADNGYRVLTLDKFFDFLDFKAQIPKKSVVITIDDGWRSTYEIAYPILRKYGFPATLFVYTDLITDSRSTLSWEMIREMSENGIDVQQHTKTHRNLASIGKKETFKEYFDALEKEFTASSKIIRTKINKEVRYVAYPYGDTNRLVIALVKKYGYRGGFTVKRGGSPFFYNNYAINRSMIYGDFDINQFEESLTAFSGDDME